MRSRREPDHSGLCGFDGSGIRERSECWKVTVGFPFSPVAIFPVNGASPEAGSGEKVTIFQ